MQKAERKYHVQAREFLNKTISMRAYIIGIVEDTREISDELSNIWKSGLIELRLADCGDEISFEFDLSTASKRENSLFKIQKIAAVVNAVRDAIEIEIRSIESRPNSEDADLCPHGYPAYRCRCDESNNRSRNPRRRLLRFLRGRSFSDV